ncbi:MAG: hypothetical protein RL701_2969 [Pseudomonadota bacterium]
MPHPRFKISKSADGQFTFNLTAANAEIILASERYTSRASAETGVESVKINALVDGRHERRTARDGRAYFVLKAANGEIIGTSETYSSKAAMETGTEAVKNNAPKAPVE